MTFVKGQSGNPATQFKPGQSGNPEGMPKGTVSWSKIIKHLLADEEFANKIIKKKPGWWNDLPNKNMANIIATAMMIKAMSGDKQAADWIAKTGFGDKLTVDYESGLFSTGKMVINVVDPKHNTAEPEPEAEDSAGPAEQPAVS